MIQESTRVVTAYRVVCDKCGCSITGKWCDTPVKAEELAKQTGMTMRRKKNGMEVVWRCPDCEAKLQERRAAWLDQVKSI